MNVGEDGQKHIKISVDGMECRNRQTRVNVRAGRGGCWGGWPEGTITKGSASCYVSHWRPC